LSDETTAPAEEVTETVASEETDDKTTTDEPTDLAAEVAKWKALSRKNEAAAKRNAEAAAKLSELEEAEMSQSEKLNRQVESLQAELTAANVQLLRNSVAAERGLDPELAAVLQGETADELNESAHQLLAAIAKRFAPKSEMSAAQSGAGVKGEGEALDPQSLVEAVWARKRRR